MSRGNAAEQKPRGQRGGQAAAAGMLSLVVFAVCVTTFQRGFSPSGLALQLIEIAAFVPLLLLGLGRAGKYLFKKVEGDEQACFILMFGIMRVPC